MVMKMAAAMAAFFHTWSRGHCRHFTPRKCAIISSDRVGATAMM